MAQSLLVCTQLIKMLKYMRSSVFLGMAGVLGVEGQGEAVVYVLTMLLISKGRNGMHLKTVQSDSSR